MAAEALGELQDIEGVEPLVGALKDEDLEVRNRAARADHRDWRQRRGLKIAWGAGPA